MSTKFLSRVCPCGFRRNNASDENYISIALSASLASSTAVTIGSNQPSPREPNVSVLCPLQEDHCHSPGGFTKANSLASVSTRASEPSFSPPSPCVSAETIYSPLSAASLPSAGESDIGDLDLDTPLSTPTTAGASTIEQKVFPALLEVTLWEEQKEQDTDHFRPPGSEEIVLGPDFHFREHSPNGEWLRAVSITWQECHSQWRIAAASSLDETAELNALATDLRPCIDDEPDIRRIVGTVLKQGVVVQCKIVSGKLFCEVAPRTNQQDIKVKEHGYSNGRLLLPLDQVLSEMRLLHLRRRNSKLETYQRQICSNMMAAQRRRLLGLTGA